MFFKNVVAFNIIMSDPQVDILNTNLFSPTDLKTFPISFDKVCESLVCFIYCQTTELINAIANANAPCLKLKINTIKLVKSFKYINRETRWWSHTCTHTLNMNTKQTHTH